MSPMYYSTHPFALLLDCGLGSDPDYQGPCTGTAGTSSPDYLSASAKSSFASGKSEILAIGAALLVLAAVLVLLRMIRKPLGVRTSPSESGDLDGYVCRKCGSDDISGSSVDLVTCGACGFAGNADSVGDGGGMSDEDFVAKLESLEPGQAWCMDCDVTYWSDGYGCPCCGGGRRDYGDDDDSWGDESAVGVCPECGSSEVNTDGDAWQCEGCGADNYADVADQRKAEDKASDYRLAVAASGSDACVCDKCGVTFEPDEGSWVGDTCSACNEAYNEAHALDDVDAGPDDEDAAHGNPDGIGADDEGLRA